MAHDVFISYAEEDRQVADAVCRALEDAGVSCWYAPRDVPYAVDYEEAIVDAISESKLLVLILSAHSNNSAHVKREVQNACREEPQVPILPFQVENISLNKALRYYIGSVQWLSALTPPLETHLQKLVTYVRPRLPQQEAEKDSTQQNDKPAEPEVRGEVREDERRRAEESRPMFEAADAAKVRAAKSPLSKVTRSLATSFLLPLIFAALFFLIWAWVFYKSGPQPANLNATPTSTQQPDQTQSTSPTAVENYYRGQELFGQEKYAEAEVYYREAVRLEPNDDIYQNKLGDALARQGKYAEAESSYREAARLKPDEDLYYFNLGWVLKEQKKYAEAGQAYHEAMRINPKDGLIRNYLGDVLYLQSKFAEAETRYREALHISPNNAAFHYSLGNALFVQGKNGEAKIEYQRAVHLDPANTSYREALQRANMSTQLRAPHITL
jgi:Flp pilus assembly protein TadD